MPPGWEVAVVMPEQPMRFIIWAEECGIWRGLWLCLERGGGWSARPNDRSSLSLGRREHLSNAASRSSASA